MSAVHGWDLDATVDLARVMRLPGTLNHKNRDAVPVTIESMDGPRTRPGHFDQILPQLSGQPAHQPAMTGPVGELVLDPALDVGQSKFAALQENAGPVFTRTWERKRRDLQDQSPSAYDLALANYAVAADWTDQEIVALLIACRRKHGDDLKLRDDYYRGTLAKARGERAGDRLLEAVTAPPAPGAEPLDRDAIREAIAAKLFAAGNVTDLHVAEFNTDPATYLLKVAVGGEPKTVTLGRIGTLLHYSQFRDKCAEAAHVLIKPFTAAEWQKVASLLLAILETEDTGAEGGRTVIGITDHHVGCTSAAASSPGSHQRTKGDRGVVKHLAVQSGSEVNASRRKQASTWSSGSANRQPV